MSQEIDGASHLHVDMEVRRTARNQAAVRYLVEDVTAYPLPARLDRALGGSHAKWTPRSEESAAAEHQQAEK